MEQTLSCVINPLNVMAMVQPARLKDANPFLNASLVTSWGYQGTHALLAVCCVFYVNT